MSAWGNLVSTISKIEASYIEYRYLETKNHIENPTAALDARAHVLIKDFIIRLNIKIYSLFIYLAVQQ